MRIHFTKMQGAGNDFVVLDETQQRLALSTAQYRWLADRRFGVGADQILSVRPAPSPDVDFEYVIHNADGGEVEHCGNGARCFVRYVREQGLTDKSSVRVKVHGGVITLHQAANGQVTVDMGAPVFQEALVPFAAHHAQAVPVATGDMAPWRIDLGQGEHADVYVLSMGNPHAVVWVDDVETAPVLSWGPLIEHHPAFPQRVNAGFAQRLSSQAIKLRVFERGAGETLACGTGACAAAVVGMRLGWLGSSVAIQARGGTLAVAWNGAGDSVHLSGPATTVFQGDIELPECP